MINHRNPETIPNMAQAHDRYTYGIYRNFLNCILWSYTSIILFDSVSNILLNRYVMNKKAKNII